MVGLDIRPSSNIEGFAVEIHGLNLNEDVAQTLIEEVRECVTKYRVVVIRNQGHLSFDRQLAVTQWFGAVEDIGFDQHVKSPHRAILRVSNDETEGFRDFGTAGFHIDGSFMRCPNSHSIYHIIHTPQKGSTLFVPLFELYNGLSPQQKERWQRLSLYKEFKRIRGLQDYPGKIVHPAVYRHPLTGMETMCVAQGKTSRFIWDIKSPQERICSKEETQVIVDEINTEIYRNNNSMIYEHKWKDGDFIISDNLAVAHFATPETQLPRDEIGLRVMHRTIVKGFNRPHRIHAVDTGNRRTKNNKKTCIIM